MTWFASLGSALCSCDFLDVEVGVFLVEPLLNVLQRVFEVDLGALELQVDQAVPDLLRLLECKHALALDAVRVMGCILENVIFPKDRVLDETLVSQSPHCAAVLVSCEFEDVAFDLKVNVVVKESLSSKIARHKHFKCAD